MSLYGPDTVFQVVLTVYDRADKNISIQVLGMRCQPPIQHVCKVVDAALRMLVGQLAETLPVNEQTNGHVAQGEVPCPMPLPS